MVLAGCRSGSAAGRTTGVAAVTVTGKTRQEIVGVATEVFVKRGYRVAPPLGCDLMFEKQGSSWNTTVYGGLSGKPVWFRVKVFVRMRGVEERLVECEVFRVLEHGDASMEEEVRHARYGGGGYQEILDEVRNKLMGVTP